MQENRWRVLGRALRKRYRHGRASIWPGASLQMRAGEMPVRHRYRGGKGCLLFQRCPHHSCKVSSHPLL